jgi:hypothetical protein
MRLWRRRPRPEERALNDRSDAIARDLVDHGLRDLDERSGFLGRLERRLLPRRETDRRR